MFAVMKHLRAVALLGALAVTVAPWAWAAAGEDDADDGEVTGEEINLVGGTDASEEGEAGASEEAWTEDPEKPMTVTIVKPYQDQKAKTEYAVIVDVYNAPPKAKGIVTLEFKPPGAKFSKEVTSDKNGRARYEGTLGPNNPCTISMYVSATFKGFTMKPPVFFQWKVVKP